ncbi:MAG TPA: glucokinase [Terriglobales bacterium]|jgi:glucokinase|nr:glucokinase [Terriglobales bacterium]
MILAGDIGGTHARLAFFNVVDGRFNLVSASIFPSRDYSGLDEIVAKFVATANLHPDTACFGIAGPVRNGRVEASNLPWVIESKRLADELQIGKAVLINDLEANAWGIPALEARDVVALNQVKGQPLGNQAVIAAGTGLGQAGMYWDGATHHVFACEGGHTDFAPRNQMEVELFNYLRTRFGHVSYERIVSGPGLVNVFNFLRDTGRGAPEQWLIEQMTQSDPAAAISRAASDGKCALCEQAVDLFISIYGAEAGNLALKIMATGGVYLGGGIAPKMLAKLSGPLFMQAFIGKGRMQALLESMPVRVITNDRIALLGAARCAQFNNSG